MIFPANIFEPDYVPKIGLTPFEVSKQFTHKGSSIFNMLETSSFSEKQLLDAVSSLDSRALQGMPQEVLDEIKAGNITHIFQTDPTGSQAYLDASDTVRNSVDGKGSIYFRTKEGKTARWKLPEISDGDAGWNANKGSSIFAEQTIYSSDDNIRSLAGAENLRKGVDRGVRSAETVDDQILNSRVYDEVTSKSKMVTGAGTAVDSLATSSTATNTTNMSPEAYAHRRRIDNQKRAWEAVKESDPKYKIALGEIESEIGGFHLSSAQQLGYDPGTILSNPEYQKAYNDVMGDIYDDVANGIDPEKAVANRISGLDLPKEVEENILKRVNIISNLPSDYSGPVDMPSRPILSQEEFEKKFSGTKIVPESTAAEAAPQPKAEGVKVGKPVPQSKPVIPASQTKTPPPNVVAKKVTETGNATPKAKVVSSAPKAVSSTGAPVKQASKLQSAANSTSSAVAKGTKNFGNLKMMGLAAAVGLGAAAYGGARRTQQDNIDRKLEMQRRGIVR